jgi:GH24 family phage-related lysozyme (muramidase)
VAADRLTWRQALSWRVRRHRLDGRASRAQAPAVTGEICGLHAQLLSSAELSLWARLKGLKPGDAERELWEERALVKTWAMRGTLHLLPAAELGTWLGALSTYDHFRKPSWHRAFGVTATELDRVIDAVGDALAGEPLTREELAAAVARGTRSKKLGEKVRESWGSLLKPAAFAGCLCFAPNQGRNVCFTRPDVWLGDARVGDPASSLETVVRRWLSAYGPATREDLARWWGGASPARAEKLIRSLGDAAVEVELEGAPAWAAAADLDAVRAAEPARTVNLLPAFDPYVIGAARDAPSLLEPAHRARVYRPQGWISPVLLVDGRMAGVWKHERKGGRVVVRIVPFGAIPKWARAKTEAEAARLARFLGGELELAWAPR